MKKHLIIADKTSVLPNLKEGYNNITSEEFNQLLYYSKLSDIMSDILSYKIKVGLVVRSTFSNKVLMWDKDTFMKERWVEEDPRDLHGYFLLMGSVQQLIKEYINVEEEVMRQTVLQPIGVVKQHNDITVVFHLIMLDADLENLTLLGTENQPVLAKINLLKNFTNLPESNRMVIHTLKEVEKSKE